MNSVGGVIGLPITNHFSQITSHGRASGPAVRFQDLFLTFPLRRPGQLIRRTYLPKPGFFGLRSQRIGFDHILLGRLTSLFSKVSPTRPNWRSPIRDCGCSSESITYVLLINVVSLCWKRNSRERVTGYWL
jgi:hypothetical protein